MWKFIFTILPPGKLIAAICLALYALPTHGEDYFDPDSIEKRQGDTAVDLSALERTGGQVEGKYLVEIYLNGTYIAEKEINFRRKHDAIVPDITKDELVGWGVRENATSAFMHLAGNQFSSPLIPTCPAAGSAMILASSALISACLRNMSNSPFRGRFHLMSGMMA